MKGFLVGFTLLVLSIATVGATEDTLTTRGASVTDLVGVPDTIGIIVVEPLEDALVPKGRNMKFALRPRVDLSTITLPVTFICQSSVDGDITEAVERSGLSGYIRTSGLSAGKHTLTFTFRDSNGKTGKGLVNVVLVEVDREIFNEIRDMIKEEVEVNGTLSEVALKTSAKRYVIDRATSDVKRTALDIKVRDDHVTDFARGIHIREYLGLNRGEAPPGMPPMDLDDGEEDIGTYVSIETNAADIEWTMIKMEFDPDEVNKRGLDGKGLFIKWFNDDPSYPNYGRWVRLGKGKPAFVNGVGIDTENNYVWANVSHLSVYGIAGGVIRAPTTETPPGETTTPTGTQVIPEIPASEGREEPAGEKRPKALCGPAWVLVLSLLPPFLKRIGSNL